MFNPYLEINNNESDQCTYDEKHIFYFEENSKQFLMNMLPVKGEKIESHQVDERPAILMKIWHSFETEKVNDKFKIFFGFNK